MHSRIIFCVVGIFIVAMPFLAFGQPQLQGACCHPDGQCLLNNNEDDCEEGEGAVWLGIGTSCDPNPCPQQQTVSVPTFSQWGILLFVALTVIGAGYSMRQKGKSRRLG
jgi:hypothetical protein